MTDSPVRIDHDPVASVLTIDRESSLNALDRRTLEALHAALEELARRPPRCLIVTGAGNKAFVAGADIAAMSRMDRSEAEEFSRLGQRAFDSVEALPLPVIAAVNGFALGGGCELALACDFIYASDKAKLGLPELKLGVIPGFGGTQRLSRRVGSAVARELIFTGRVLGPQEALRIGLVNAVVPRRELLGKVHEVAGEIAQVGPAALASAKRVMRQGADRELTEALELEARAFGSCFDGDERREGMLAFSEKRKPSFAR